MPEIERKEYEVEPEKEEDIIVKAGGFRVYFQNYYTIISMGNDLLTGSLYFIGSLCNLFGAPAIIGQVLYLAGGFFLLMRPILKIAHNVFIYDEEEYQEEVEDVGITEESDRGYNEGYYGEPKTQDEKKEEIKETEDE